MRKGGWKCVGACMQQRPRIGGKERVRAAVGEGGREGGGRVGGCTPVVEGGKEGRVKLLIITTA